MVMPLYSLLLPLMTMITMLSVISQRKSLLMTLLCLEAMVLSLVLFAALTLGPFNQMEMFTSLILLVFGACEAAIGLAILVSMTRRYGSDHVKLMTASKC
uniref:NADH dehydrogenase subunit 4L n=1 Tax=Asychis amphiglyptus TaxID=1931186 RepID=UPI0022DCE274|nr:NADH dehydrogenase subunit 4L [Asychis amphiglyptus]UZZ45810.1 NADH dehydrogenase subunit 4L [Asychis amphiglyptus]